MMISINTAVFLNELQNGISQYECLKKLVGLPIENIEVRGEFFDNNRSSELKKIRELCEQNSWGFYFSIPEELFTDNELNENIFEYLKMAEANHIQGLKISLGSFKNIDDLHMEELIDYLQETKIKITVENQPNQNSTLEKFSSNLNSILEMIPELGYTFDSGNWYWIYEKPEQAFEALKNNITIFHLKDIKNLETVLLGEGDTSWERLILELNGQIPVFLEYEIDRDNLKNEIDKVNSKLI